MANTEYFITKLTFEEDRKLIDHAFAYEFDGTTLSSGEKQDRAWMVDRINKGYHISILKPNPEIDGKWISGKAFTYSSGYFGWDFSLPLNSTKHKTFVSYYHKDDQDDRQKFERQFRDLVVSKSVEKDDIDSDNSDEYIKQLIQKDYLKDTTVLAVLVGPNTKCRKHVDWEISGAINQKVGGPAGVIGILLPSHPDYGTGKYDYKNLPERLAKNAESGYAIIIEWTDDRVKMQEWIEVAFQKRNETDKRITTSVPQMTEDTCS
jgi:hypothetical protein